VQEAWVEGEFELEMMLEDHWSDSQSDFETICGIEVMEVDEKQLFELEQARLLKSSDRCGNKTVVLLIFWKIVSAKALQA